MCATLLCCARLRRDAEERKASELDSLICWPDLIFRYFLFVWQGKLCANRNPHAYTYNILIYNPHPPGKKGTFSRGRKRAGAQAPFYVYVCTCLPPRLCADHVYNVANYEWQDAVFPRLCCVGRGRGCGRPRNPCLCNFVLDFSHYSSKPRVYWSIRMDLSSRTVRHSCCPLPHFS